MPTVEERLGDRRKVANTRQLVDRFIILEWYSRATSKVCRADSGHPAEQNNHITHAVEPLAATLLTRSWLGTTNLNARFLFATSDIIGVNSCLFKGAMLLSALNTACVLCRWRLPLHILSCLSYCSVSRNLHCEAMLSVLIERGE